MVKRQNKRFSRNSDQGPLVVLAAAVVLNAAIYLLLFVRPLNLLSLYGQPLLDLRKLSMNDPLARWRLMFGFALLGGLYWLGWRAALRARGRVAWGLVAAGALSSSAILLFLYPFEAADIFDNIIHGRILGVYGENPFQLLPADFSGDPFLPYVAWKRFPSAYGPGWELVAAVVARLAGDGILANVLAFKLLGGGFLAGSVLVVAVLLHHKQPERALPGALLLAWNPLVLYLTLGQGHNDVAMVFWILLAVWGMARSRHTLSVLALVCGALFKFIPLLLLPVVGLASLRALPGARARMRFAVVTGGAALLLVVLTYAPFWYGLDTLGIGRRQALLTSSLPATVYALLLPSLGKAVASLAVSLVAAGIIGLFALWQGVRASRDPGWQSFVQAAFTTLVFYLLCTCLWFQQWYMLWPLALVPLLPRWRLSWLGIALGFLVLAKPLIFEPIWLWPHSPADRGWLELRFGLAVLSIPWLFTLVSVWKGWWGPSTKARRPTR